MNDQPMHDLRRFARKPLALIAAPLCWLALAGAQAPERPVQQEQPAPQEKPVEREKPKLPGALQGQPGGDSSKDEMIELFHKVEKRLSEIDKLLYQASAGERALTRQNEAGISELLKSSVSKSEQVTRDIDRILEIAAENGSSCSSCMSGEPKPSSSSGSPLDQQQLQQSARENTPDKPGQKPGPKPEGQEPQSAQSGQPKSPREANTEPHQRPAGAPPGLATEKLNAEQATERWGDLPQHVRDLFRTEGGGDMPLQYRDWIDSYYRRLNQKR